MTTYKRKKGSPSSTSQNKKKKVRTASEEEVFSPEILPIDDHWKEKKLIELNNSDYIRYLWVERSGEREGTLSMEALHDRIRKVYRLCFESGKKENMDVINDFATFQPYLIFNTPWLAFLIKRHTIYGSRWDNSVRKRLFKALGAGFQRAAYSKLRTNRWLRSIKLHEGKALLEELKDELRQFCRSDDWVDGDREEVVSEKVARLVERYPLVEKFREKLREHLLHRGASAAARLVVNKTFGVADHDLKSKRKF